MLNQQDAAVTAGEPPTHQVPVIEHWIDGRLLAGGLRTRPVFNPALGVPQRHVALADEIAALITSEHGEDT
jgi:malonate-semialdehyde dehydrogenase (acetylating) / methylmalonate-semialdehyde dehydrogenase